MVAETVRGSGDWRRAPGHGRYALPERERRFLIAQVPPSPELPREIEDRYLDGTRLRLRHVRVDGESVYKLTQKVRVHDGDPADVAITNIYLSADEHARLCALPAAVLCKTRWNCLVGGRRFAFDEFQGVLSGLRLAEVEVEDLSEELELPEWVGREVTADERFTGGSLARVDADDVQELLDVT